MVNESKPLGSEDSSAVEFVKEMLAGDPTYAINFDRIQWDHENKRYVIVEFLLCEEKQSTRGITPLSSHPNRYFMKNSMKFISLWKLSQVIGAKLFLVNYSKAGTSYEDQVLLMEVQNVDATASAPVQTINSPMTRQEFSSWFRTLNRRGRT
ncbi:hypothetical protein ABFB09_02930 [Dehalogenimonas sp. THU2]|uniref:hypothetical protein n=1 Tax=Dehalogenimonas sp. THU2 TaxID=3151121 RepID=UPI003218BE84